MNRPGKIAVFGGGAWGTALALAAKRAGNEVWLWARDEETVAAINSAGRNPRYLPGITFSGKIAATTSIETAIAGSDCILAAIPAQALGAMLNDAAALVPAGVPIVACAKGIERTTGRLMSQIISEALPENPVAALSGPSFAVDVASGKPTAVTIAASDESRAAELAAMLSGPHFRCYSTDDVMGVEIGGALKNVLAIAAGAVSGAKLGASAEAAVITRGFVELRRMGAAFGARPETLMGLSGLGDLVLTCSSAQSRNFAYGMAAGRGDDLEGLPLAEGVATAAIAMDIARRHALETPIIDAVNTILSGKADIGEIVAALMARPLKSETE